MDSIQVHLIPQPEALAYRPDVSTLISLVEQLEEDGWVGRRPELAARRFGDRATQELVARGELAAWLQDLDSNGHGALLPFYPPDDARPAATDSDVDVTRDAASGVALLWVPKVDLVHPPPYGDYTLACPNCSADLMQQFEAQGQTLVSPYGKPASEVLATCSSCREPVQLEETKLRGPSLSGRESEEIAPFCRFSVMVDVELEELTREPLVVDASLLERIRGVTGLSFRSLDRG